MSAYWVLCCGATFSAILTEYLRRVAYRVGSRAHTNEGRVNLRSNVVGGVGGIAFAVLSAVAVLVAAPLGGTYKVSDATDYLAKGHRPAVFVSAYLFMLGVLGLICLLVRLRQADLPGCRIVWGTGLAAAAAFAAGWGLVVSVPLALAYGGKSLSISPNVAYML
jgi:hypothetical protein